MKGVKDATISMLPVEGVFVAVGLEPGTGFLGRNMTLDEKGYLITNELMETERFISSL